MACGELKSVVLWCRRLKALRPENIVKVARRLGQGVDIRNKLSN
jgi:hypothetical protein